MTLAGILAKVCEEEKKEKDTVSWIQCLKQKFISLIVSESSYILEVQGWQWYCSSSQVFSASGSSQVLIIFEQLVGIKSQESTWPSFFQGNTWDWHTLVLLISFARTWSHDYKWQQRMVGNVVFSWMAMCLAKMLLL